MYFLFLGQGNQSSVKQEAPPRRPIRRNLCASLPPQSPQTVTKAQVFEEGMLPLHCTPERTAQAIPLVFSKAVDPNMTFEILDQTASDATIIISAGTPCQASNSSDLSGPNQLSNLSKANEGNQIPYKRWN